MAPNDYKIPNPPNEYETHSLYSIDLIDTAVPIFKASKNKTEEKIWFRGTLVTTTACLMYDADAPFQLKNKTNGKHVIPAFVAYPTTQREHQAQELAESLLKKAVEQKLKKSFSLHQWRTLVSGLQKAKELSLANYMFSFYDWQDWFGRLVNAILREMVRSSRRFCLVIVLHSLSLSQHFLFHSCFLTIPASWWNCPRYVSLSTVLLRLLVIHFSLSLSLIIGSFFLPSSIFCFKTNAVVKDTANGKAVRFSRRVLSQSSIIILVSQFLSIGFRFIGAFCFTRKPMWW
jgi:hypothetical protein